MSKNITYKCNLCLDIKKPEVLYCVYYGIIPNESPKQGYYLTTNLNNSDKHICLDCISMINKMEDDTNE